MNLNDFKTQITKNLSSEIKKNSSEYLRESLNYAVLPTGKLIRSSMIWAYLTGNNHSINHDHILFGTSLELHHSYTLVHDDLPSMDNDDIRRGKPSHHKKYNPAKAILAGDALLAMSFSSLRNIKHHNLSILNQFYHWAIGAKGLILGQELDLEQNQKSFQTILRIFELKTSRLFQVAIIGSYLLSIDKKPNYKIFKECLKLGSDLGILFQIADDLDDFKNNKTEELNIFKNFPNEAKLKFDSLKNQIQQNNQVNLKFKELFNLT